METDEQERIVNCQQHVRDALTSTLATCRRGLAEKFGISHVRVRDAIGWAAVNIAVENYLGVAEFGEDQCRHMEIHVNYLFYGARNFQHNIGERENELFCN